MTLDEIVVRRVDADDLAAVRDIANSRLKERYSDSLFGYFYENFSGCFLVAASGKEVLGYIICIPLDRTTLRIMMLAVRGDASRKGIGISLLSSAESYAVMKRMNCIALEVGVENSNAIDFYKKRGFSITERLPNYYLEGRDAYVMKRFLPL